MMEKLIITAALTGAQQGKAANPNLPEQPDEIVEQAIECWRAGAAIVHCHARDKEGRPTADKEVFRRIFEPLKEKTDLVICLSTGGARSLPLEERVAMIPAFKPDLASYNIGSAMQGIYDFKNKKWLVDFSMSQSFADLEFIGRTMLENGTKAELEIYDFGMISNALLFRDIGVLKEPLHFSFVMGIPGQTPTASPKNLLHLVESLPPGSTYQVIGIGRHEFPMITMGIILGGNIRVGLEDNLYIERGKLASSNAQLVEKAVRIARELGRKIATPWEARRILSLDKN
jgi:3-keto-5-aminohexanoate cleavage enzyme